MHPIIKLRFPISDNFKFTYSSIRIGKSSNTTEREIENFEEFMLYRSKGEQKLD